MVVIMKRYLYVLISAITSGFCITIGASVYLSLIETNKIVGSLLFGFGLFTIIHFNIHLYTGKVGNVLNKKPIYLIELLICMLGNFIGVIFLSFIIKQTRIGDNLAIQALKLVEAKQNDTWYSILILATMCGVMIYLAVKGYQKSEYPLGKVIFCFLAISIFILCSFEHCIANAAYYTLAGVFNLKALGYFLLMILGNAIGAIVLDGIFKVIDYIKLESQKAQEN